MLRLLIATPDEKSLSLIYSILDSALYLTPFEVTSDEVDTYTALKDRIEKKCDDVLVLDWQMKGSETPRLVTELLQYNPRLRVVVLLPEHYRQYRRLIWEAGACNGIPKEHMDQEWLSTVLCIMYRAMEREAALSAKLSQG
ncbi:MAG: hypothetical protein KDJ65_37290 [Anaerolineae bacterium]|nr:hypothetical protein [Anaerolineae bacterium]